MSSSCISGSQCPFCFGPTDTGVNCTNPRCTGANVSTTHSTTVYPQAQKCPICQGTGLVSRPPHVAGDQDHWTSGGCGPYPCRACQGSGIIYVYPESSS